jgi:aminopeptidase N
MIFVPARASAVWMAFALLLMVSCSASKKSTTEKSTTQTAPSQAPSTSSVAQADSLSRDSSSASTAAHEEGEDNDLDDAIERSQGVPVWAPKVYKFNPSRERKWDLLHTALDARLDFDRCELNGTATLKLTPFFYPQDSLVLDAKGMLIQSITRVDSKLSKPLSFRYPDSLQLVIAVGGTMKAGEALELRIQYTARPNLRPLGGSEAISSDKGLYFINPTGKEPNKPRQVWTQGETEATSVWLPTIDSPNERCTQSLTLTVPDTLTTLSNGVMVRSVKLPGRLRADTWQLNQPHAPYLFMLAAGTFGVVKDNWRGKEVSYYLDPEYVPYARSVFGRTPEMIEFFSTRLGTPYPWPNYREIVIHDFVSGAMENTTAVTFYDALNADNRSLLDGNHDDIISHELFHHWFGDYVTTESWANLPLNESFATYGEYLWFEYKDGRLAADRHLEADLKRYLEEANEKREPLIRYYYRDREDMFDRHTYQKGGRVLHYLRYQLGDEAFFAGLKLYLSKHAYQPVEIHDLRQAFEQVSGRDLQRFFEQWFMSAGHPEIQTDYSYDSTTRRLEVSVTQTQDRAYQPLYELPLAIEVVLPAGASVQRLRYPVTITSADTTLTYSLTDAPLYVDVDADKVIPGLLKEDKPFEGWLAQLAHGTRYKQLADALDALADTSSPVAYRAILNALNHPYWGLRLKALEALDQRHLEQNLSTALPRLVELMRDPRAEVRSAAAERLASIAEQASAPKDPTGESSITLADAERQILMDALKLGVNDSSYLTTASSIRGLYRLQSSAALGAVKKNKQVRSNELRAVVANVLLAERTDDAYPYTIDLLQRLGSDFAGYTLLQSFGQYLTAAEQTEQEAGLSLLMQRAEHDPTWYYRLGAMNALNGFSERPDIRSFIQRVILAEKNPRLRSLYLGGGR